MWRVRVCFTVECHNWVSPSGRAALKLGTGEFFKRPGEITNLSLND